MRKFLETLRFPRNLGVCFRTQARYTLPYLLLILILAFGGGFLVSNRLVRDARVQFDASLEQAARIGADLIVREENRMLENLRLLANTTEVWEGIQLGDAEALRELVFPQVLNSNQDLVAILGLDGSSLLTLQRRAGSGAVSYQATRGSTQFGNLFFVRRILTEQQDSLGDKFAEIASVDGETILLIAGPVRDKQDELVGVIVIGRSLAGLAADLERETGYPANFYRLDGQLLASTLNGQPPLDIETAKAVVENQAELGYLHTYDLQGKSYREIVTVFEARGKQDFGLKGVAADTAPLENTTRHVRTQVYVYALLLFVLTLVVGCTLSVPIGDETADG